MPKYNILRDDQIENESKKSDDKLKKSDTKPDEEKIFDSTELSAESKAKQTPDEDYFSEELFPVGDDKAPDNDFEEGQEKDQTNEEQIEPQIDFESQSTESDSESPVIYDETAESEYPLAEKKYEDKPLFDYEEDHKQEKLNYKPIFIGGAIVIGLIAIYLIVTNVFLGESEIEIPEQKVESAQEKLVREQEERKLSFISDLNQKTRYNLNNINQLIDLNQSRVKYSSVLLYGNSLNLEVFVPDREVLAKYNLSIKEDRNVDKYNIEGVTQRRGSNGGLLALYNINMAKNAINSKPDVSKFIKIAPEDWSGTFVSKSGMTINSNRLISNKRENLFQIQRIEYELRGSLDSSVSLINQLASTSTNIAVHKLMLLPTDQKNMSTSSYMLKLIIDFYL